MPAAKTHEQSGWIVRNSSLLYATEVCGQLASLFVTVVAAKALGPGGFGEFALAATLVAFAAVVADFGLSAYLIKQISSESRLRRGTATVILLLKVSLLILCLAAAFFFAGSAGGGAQVKQFLLIAGAGSLLGCYSSIVCAALKATNRFGYDSIIRISGRFVYAASALSALALHTGLFGLATAFFSAALLETVLAARINARLLLVTWHRRPPLQLSAYYDLLKAAWPFGALTILGLIYFRIDILMLQAIRGPVEVGCYEAGYRVLEGILMVPWALSTVLLPVFSRQLSFGGTPAPKDLVESCLKYLTYAGVLIAAYVASFAQDIIRWLYPMPAFQPAIGGLQVLSLAIIAVFISGVTSTLINAGRSPQINVWIAAAMVVENIGLNLLWIPRWGLVGAALATIVTEFSGIVMNTLYIRAAFFTVSYHRAVFCSILAAAAMMGSIALLRSPAFLPVHLGAYLCVLGLVGGISRQDRQRVRLVFLRAFNSG